MKLAGVLAVLGIVIWALWVRGPSQGADSPEALLANASEAAHAADGAQVLATIVPEGRMAFVSRMAARMDGARGFDLGECSMRHGLGNLSNRTSAARTRELEMSVDDPMELDDFLSEMLAARSPDARPLFGPLLGSAKALGDSATGTVALGDKEVEARFALRDGRYFIAPTWTFP